MIQQEFINKIYNGDCIETLRSFPDNSIDMCITSPPYFNLRDYGVNGQIGNEKNIDEYIDKLATLFSEVKRLLKDSGSVWVNLGDTYDDKNLSQIPSRFALKMTDDIGYRLRNEIIWHKPVVMPSSAKDRFTVDHEKFFFFTKNSNYYFDTQYEPVKESSVKRAKYGLMQSENEGAKNNAVNVQTLKMGERFVSDKGRIKRTVWTINPSVTKDKEEHFATFPEELITTPILACCPIGGIVLDPFMGSGTTALVAKKFRRNFVGIEINPKYIKIAHNKISNITKHEDVILPGECSSLEEMWKN